MKHAYIPVTALLLFINICPHGLHAESGSLYINRAVGDDANPGTLGKPLKTMQGAATRLERMKGRGPVTIKLAPGIYPIEKSVRLAAQREFTQVDRLVIEAAISPDDARWNPGRMPILLSVEDPRNPEDPGKPTETYSLKVAVDHVTIRGLCFRGNPLMRNYPCAIERVGKGRNDLEVTQCLFIGGRGGLDLYCPVIGTGDGLVVEHCVFYRCHNAVVLWDGTDAIGGKRHAVRNCIMAECDVSAVWTCRTAEDFVFKNNVVTGCKYVWMRKPGDRQTYTMKTSVLSNIDFLSGCGEDFGPFRITSKEVVFVKQGVIEDARVMLDQREESPTYLHVVPGTPGSDLGAGLFKK
jgi:hypothetical protein